MEHREIIEYINKCIKLEKPARIPCLPLGLEFDVAQSGLSHREFRTDPANMTRVGVNAIEQFGYDWFILFPDDLIEWEFTGIKVSDDDISPPAVTAYLPPTRETLNKLCLPDPEHDGRMPLHLEGLSNLKRELNNRACLAGRIAAPFSAVSLLIGVEALMFMMMEDPELLKDFMAYTNACNEIWANAQLEAGADILWLGDCMATSHFIPPDYQRDLALEPADRSAQIIRKGGGISIYHGGETSLPHLENAVQISCDAINVGEKADMAEVKKLFSGKKCAMGNLDPIKVLREGSVEIVEDSVKELLDKAGPGGAYIFCTGEGIPHDVPPENVKVMVDTVRNYK
jgi:MtaA/CmuA family methyltransferase